MNGAFSPFSSFEIVICLHVGFDDNHQFNPTVTDLTTHMIPFLLRAIANLFVFFCRELSDTSNRKLRFSDYIVITCQPSFSLYSLTVLDCTVQETLIFGSSS